MTTFLADLENLKKHKNVKIEEVKIDKDLEWILERGIYLLIQNLFDILTYICSSRFQRKLGLLY